MFGQINAVLVSIRLLSKTFKKIKNPKLLSNSEHWYVKCQPEGLIKFSTNTVNKTE